MFLLSVAILGLMSHAQEAELVVQTGHTNMITVLSFSPDGQTLASSSYDKTIKIWHVASGRELRTLISVPRYDTAHAVALSFSPDGKTLAAATDIPARISLWDVATGKELKRFGDNGFVAYSSIAYSPDGKRLVTGAGKDIFLWDVKTGQKVQTLSGHKEIVSSVLFSTDGGVIASGSNDKTVKLWNAANGGELRTLTGHSDEVSSIAFSPDDKSLISVSQKRNRVISWDVATGKTSVDYSSQLVSIMKVGFAPDSEAYVLSGFPKLRVRKLADLATKSEDEAVNLRDVSEAGSYPLVAAVSPNGAQYAVAQLNGSIKLKGVAGEELAAVADSSASARKLNFTENGEILAVVFFDGKVVVWNVAVAREIRTFNLDNRTGDIWSVAVSNGGQVVAVGNSNREVVLWDVSSGKKLRTLRGHDDTVFHLAFSPDGNVLATKGGKTITLWDVGTGKEIKSIVDKSEGAWVDPAPDQEILPIVPDYSRYSWDDTTSPNGKFKVKGGENGRLNLVEVKTDELLANLYIMGESDWAVVTPDGRFDTNRLDAPHGLHWLLPDAPLTPFSFEVLMRDYFEPNLLPRLLKCRGDSTCQVEFKPLPSIANLNRVQPVIKIKEVRLATSASDLVDVTIEATDVTKELSREGKRQSVSSGIYDLRLFRDGQLTGGSTPPDAVQRYNEQSAGLSYQEETKIWREANDLRNLKDLKFDRNGKATLTFHNVRLPYNGKKQVEFSAYAFNTDRVKSNTDRKNFDLPVPVSTVRKKGRAYLLTIGVNDSDNPRYNLHYAANDARKMQEVVGARLKAEVGRRYTAVVQIQLISDAKGGKKSDDARKDIIRGVFAVLAGRRAEVPNVVLERIDAIARVPAVEPEDTLIISFSGHGYADQNGVFYMLPADMPKDVVALTADALKRTISSDELSLWMRDITAQEMLMVVDACHSAAAVQGKNFKPGPMGSRGLGQLAYDKGMRILTATQADNVALELERLQQGLLSYTLIQEGIENRAADTEVEFKQLTSAEWLGFAVEAVPRLYEDILAGKVEVLLDGKRIVRGQKGRDVSVDPFGNPQKASGVNLQQPSLFDFRRKRVGEALFDLP